VQFSDSSGNSVVPEVTSIFQDEPSRVIGSGNFCPDGLIKDGSAYVRSERTGNPQIPGDGRVYHIQFNLDQGGTPCSGEVTLCVPHDQRAGHTCVDQGALYDSTQCLITSALNKDGKKAKNSKNGKNNKKNSRGKKH
jgi:hypothetical protein